MAEHDAASELRAGIARWQQKHGIADGDPALACLELFDLYIASLRTRGPEQPPLRFEEFRSTLELLDARSKTFTKHAAELVPELRAASQMLRQQRRRSLLGYAFALLIAFVGGIFTGIFLW